SAESTADVLGFYLDGAGVIEPSVVALADNRNHEVLGSDRRIRRDRGGDGAVVDASDRHRRRQIHGGLDAAPLGDLDRAGQFAGSIEDGGAGANRRPDEPFEAAGDDRRHPGPRDAAAAGWVGFVSADGDVSDRYALDVGDRVPWPGFELADRQSVVAQPLGRHGGTVPGLRPGGRAVRAPESGEPVARKAFSSS